MTTLSPAPPAGSLVDEHIVLLWQTCAYAEDLIDAARSKQRMTPAYDTMLQFLHYGLLPYLSREEQQLPPSELRDEHMIPLLLADHERLRDDVDNVELSRTRRLLTLATGALVDRLDRHVRREESWVTNASTGVVADADLNDWALPLLLSHDIDLVALPAGHRSVPASSCTTVWPPRTGWPRRALSAG